MHVVVGEREGEVGNVDGAGDSGHFEEFCVLGARF